MGAGDPGMEDIYHWDADGPRIAFKGPEGTRRMHLLAHWLCLSQDTCLQHSSGIAHS